MPVELPYLSTYKNVGTLFDKVANARTPDAFTTRYLADTLGLKASGDRQLITIMKALGFLDSSGKPTPAYNALKNPAAAPGAIALATKRAYAPLFDANERADQLSAAELRGLVAQISGADPAMTSKIVGTLSALLKKADFSRIGAEDATEASAAPQVPEEEEQSAEAGKPARGARLREPGSMPMKPEFHYNIQIHMPANATEETYLHIFNALRKAFSI